MIYFLTVLGVTAGFQSAQQDFPQGSFRYVLQKIKQYYGTGMFFTSLNVCKQNLCAMYLHLKTERKQNPILVTQDPILADVALFSIV